MLQVVVEGSLPIAMLCDRSSSGFSVDVDVDINLGHFAFVWKVVGVGARCY